jgi:hypothetical protein
LAGAARVRGQKAQIGPITIVLRAVLVVLLSLTRVGSISMKTLLAALGLRADGAANGSTRSK